MTAPNTDMDPKELDNLQADIEAATQGVDSLSARVSTLEDKGLTPDPNLSPDIARNLELAIAIPYTTTIPTSTPVSGTRVVYFDGVNYWLYIYANGAWRKQQLGSSRIGSLILFDSSTSVSVSEGTFAFPVPAAFNGFKLTDALANVYVKGVTGSMTLQVRRSRAGTDVDMLTSALSLGNVYSASGPTINASNSDVATGDQIYIDVDTIHTTPAKGLSVALTFA